MSLYGALYAGVAGLQAQSNKLGIISDNVANVNTIGYKSSVAAFETLVTGSNNATAYSPGGVLGVTQQLVNQQGLLQTTSSPTDIAISGDGFFVVNQTSEGGDSGRVLYTRAGSFTQDAQGNFRNTTGFFLQAWPLDTNGLLPGAPGNTSNTTSSANLSSLQTVNVENVTGTASPTTTITLGANLNASQTAFLGAAGVADLDENDTVNSGLRANDLMVPSAVNSITRNDEMTIATGSGLSYNYRYGGFAVSRSVTAGTGGDAGTTLTNGQTTLNTTASTSAIGSLSATNGSAVITVDTTGNHNLQTGDFITISGLTTAVGGIAIGNLNITAAVTRIDANTFTYTALAAAGANGTSAEAATATPRPFATTNASNTVTVSQAGHTYQVGDVVTFSGISAAVNGIPAAELNSRFVIASVSTNSYTIVTPTTAASSTGAGGTGTIIADIRPFGGFMLDATNANQPFLGVTGTTAFTSAALSFTITTATAGTARFTYSSSSPNAALGQFNNLANLASAINEVDGLTARVVNNQLYVGALDANEAVVFENGSVDGTSGPPVQAGINWINELGLANVAIDTSGTRFSTLQSLADAVNNSAGLTASVTNPLGTSSVTINVEDPLDTITFSDESSTYTTNVGSLLGALGFEDSDGNSLSLNSTAYSGTPQTTGPLGPAYGANNSAINMASGAIPAQFSRPINVFDAQGTPHNLNVTFLKIATNTWAVEVYAQPASDVSNANGQVTSGTITFNGDGSLRSITQDLTDPIPINWTTGADASQISIDWGDPSSTEGMTQFDSGFEVNFVNQNGAPVGQLTGVSIDDEGFITVSFSNGQTQRLYKIPLADFTDSNRLQSVSGNAFAQTSESGEVNLKQAGQSGVGSISSGTLEASNVELASQLTDMIVAQRAYQANTKVISTADQLLSDLDSILR